MPLHCAQRFKSLRCATETKRMEVCTKNPLRTRERLKATSPREMVKRLSNGKIPPHADDETHANGEKFVW